MTVVGKESEIYGANDKEPVFLIDCGRASAPKTRPLEISVLNLTPDGKRSETGFVRLISNFPLQVNVTFLKTSSTEEGGGFCRPFTEVEAKKFDGMIITGAPEEDLPLKRTAYWRELQDILDWTCFNVTSAMFAGLGANAALYRFYGIKKHPQNECFGVFSHRRIRDGIAEPLMRGISDEFNMPHFRHAAVYAKDVLHVPDLKILAYSKRAGASIIKSADNRRVFVTGHMEYGRYDLRDLYLKELERDKNARPPQNYFADREMKDVNMSWGSSAALFFMNWLNYCVYQATPYDISTIER